MYDAYVQGITLMWGSFGPCACDWVEGVSELLSVVVSFEVGGAACANYLGLRRIGPSIPGAFVILSDCVKFGGTRVELSDIARLSPVGHVGVCDFVIFVSPFIGVSVQCIRCCHCSWRVCRGE